MAKNINIKQKASKKTSRASYSSNLSTKKLSQSEAERIFNTREELDMIDETPSSQISRFKFNRFTTVTATAASNMIILNSSNVGFRVAQIADDFRYYRFRDVHYRFVPNSAGYQAASFVPGTGFSTTTSITDLESLYQTYLSADQTVAEMLTIREATGLTGRKWLFTSGSGADASDVETGTLMFLGTTSVSFIIQIMGTIEFMGPQDPLIAVLHARQTSKLGLKKPW